MVQAPWFCLLSFLNLCFVVGALMPVSAFRGAGVRAPVPRYVPVKEMKDLFCGAGVMGRKARVDMQYPADVKSKNEIMKDRGEISQVGTVLGSLRDWNARGRVGLGLI